MRGIHWGAARGFEVADWEALLLGFVNDLILELGHIQNIDSGAACIQEGCLGGLLDLLLLQFQAVLANCLVN